MNNVSKNNDCPPRMSDGRFFTDYRPRNDIHLARFVAHDPSRTSNDDFRTHLVRDADVYMHQDRAAAYNANACKSCSDTTTSRPHTRVSCTKPQSAHL